MEADLIAYKLMVKDGLSVLLFKVSAKNEESKLDILHRICMERMV